MRSSEIPATDGPYSRPTLIRWVVKLLLAAGLDPSDAGTVAANVVDAECRGVCSHGMLLLPTYVDRIVAGGIRRRYEVKSMLDAGALVLLDGDGGPGQSIATHAMQLAMERAHLHGVGWVTVRNSNHCGMLATYSLQAAIAGMVGFVLTNSGPSLAAHGGRGRRLGNNAICVAAPAAPHPLVFDAATGTVASGKIRLAALLGEDIPTGWLQGPDGAPSTNSDDLDRGGAVLPLGGHKGYGLAVAIDMLTALLSGGPTSLDVGGQRTSTSRPTGATQTFVALRVGDDTAATAGRVRAFVDELRASHPSGTTPVLAPGDIEIEQAKCAHENGLLLPLALIHQLNNLSRALHVPSLVPDAPTYPLPE